METRYTLMFSFVVNNTVGAVIAPEGKENVPEKERGDTWRCIIKPLMDEVAYGKDIPNDDVKAVAKEIMKFLNGGEPDLMTELHRKPSHWGKKE